MKKKLEYYISYDKWNGKIYKISKSEFESEYHNIIKLSDDLIQDINQDKISIESVFVANNKLHKKDSTIYFPKKEELETEINIVENGLSDINLELYKENKLLDIKINIRSLRTWYNHRMEDRFSFGNQDPLIFIFKKDNKIIKELTIPIDNFLETFQTTVDLSDIKNLDKIKIYTNRVVPKYQLIIYLNKYYEVKTKETHSYKKIDYNEIKENYDMIIFKTNKPNVLYIKNNIKNPNEKKIFKDLELYITGTDPNEIHSTIHISLKKIWKKERFMAVYNCNLENKIFYCNNKYIRVLYNHKEVQV